MSDMEVEDCAASTDDQGEKELLEPSESYQAVKCRWLQCGVWFASLRDLARHVSGLHASAPSPPPSGHGHGLFYCRWDGCSRSHRGFNARYKMLVHIRTHTNEKPHQCYECNKCFSRAENLKIHARSHTGEKPYVCPVPGCNKAYSNSSDRFKHTRTHQVERPYACKVPGCDKRYTDPSSLRKHAKTYNHHHHHQRSRYQDQNSREREESDLASGVGGGATGDKPSRQVQLDYVNVTTHISTSCSWLHTLYTKSAWAEEQEGPLDLTVHSHTYR